MTLWCTLFGHKFVHCRQCMEQTNPISCWRCGFVPTYLNR